jgi:hypothetical protein
MSADQPADVYRVKGKSLDELGAMRADESASGRVDLAERSRGGTEPLLGLYRLV